MKVKCLLGMHDWSADCEKCCKCGKTRPGAHSWSGCRCSKCDSHRWEGVACSVCRQPNYAAMLGEIYDIGHRLDIVGFIEHSKTQFVESIRQCSTADDKVQFVGKKFNYLAGVIGQMFNPCIYDSDVDMMRQISDALKKLL